MKNITISLDDNTYQRARTKAAAMNTDLSALVRGGLSRWAPDETFIAQCKQEEHTLRESIKNFTTSDRLSREDVHDRHGLS